MRYSDPRLVLFFCRWNPSGTFLAETIFNHLAHGKQLHAFSSVKPSSRAVSPYALECLAAHGITAPGSSRRRADILGPEAPSARFLISLCEGATHRCRFYGESGARVRGHWGMPDPDAVTGSTLDKRLAFEQAFDTLRSRIKRFLALPCDRLNDRKWSTELTRIADRLT